MPHLKTQETESVAIIGRRVALREQRSHLQNALYGIADYVAQPIGMLIAAPFFIRMLGLKQYGIWMLILAVLGSMGTLSSGFGDATIKFVSQYRGSGDLAAVQRVIRAALTINCTLGGIFFIALWITAPMISLRLFKIEPQYHQVTIVALRIAGAIMFARSVESVFSSTLRAYESYAPTVKINVFARASSITASVILVALHFGLATMMYANLVIGIVAVVFQLRGVQQHIGAISLAPGFHKSTLLEMGQFGCFSWLQALAAVAFMHADRLLVGVMLGTTAVAYYSLCVQATQPIHGILSSALNFLFPTLSCRYEIDVVSTKRMYRKALWVSVLLAASFSIPLAVFGKSILTLWMGPGIAYETKACFSVLAVAYGLLAMNIVPHYALLAFGQVRYVSVVNILGGLISLLVAVALIPVLGLLGAALGRLLYGPLISLNFIRVRQFLYVKRDALAFS